MISAVKKVSYVISIHNGFETFQYTLPIILREFNREIAQLIIIDNASTDGLKDITSTFWDNSGVEYIRCNNKLKFGDALSEGIALAKGEWICYLGDDDLVNFSVFAMYQQHFESVESDMIVTDSIRFNWLEGCEVAEVLFSESQEKISVINSEVARAEMLNKLSINAGGSFYIRKNIYAQILKKTGHFTPPQGAEFFIFRAALYLTKLRKERSFSFLELLFTLQNLLFCLRNHAFFMGVVFKGGATLMIERGKETDGLMTLNMRVLSWRVRFG